MSVLVFALVSLDLKRTW